MTARAKPKAAEERDVVTAEERGELDEPQGGWGAPDDGLHWNGRDYDGPQGGPAEGTTDHPLGAPVGVPRDEGR